MRRSADAAQRILFETTQSGENIVAGDFRSAKSITRNGIESSKLVPGTQISIRVRVWPFDGGGQASSYRTSPPSAAPLTLRSGFCLNFPYIAR